MYKRQIAGFKMGIRNKNSKIWRKQYASKQYATKKRIHEDGSEIVQLAFTLPLLCLIFGLGVQMCIWVIGSIQFAQANEIVVSNISTEKISEVGASSSTARNIIAQAIASNMVGVSADEIEVSNVAISDVKNKYANGQAIAIGKTYTLNSDGTSNYHIMQLECTGTLSFSATYTCKNIVNVIGNHTLTLTPSCERLLSKTTEVRENV